MFKNMISPVQAWLLSQKRCVGCGAPLRGSGKVTCKCGRVYLQENGKYRRALLSEINS